MMALAFCVGPVMAGCGGTEAVNKAEVTLKLSPTNPATAENLLLDQIYEQALKKAGYKVRKVSDQALIGISKLAALQSGKIAGRPVHLSTTLYFDFGVEIDELPTRTNAAYAEAKSDFEKRGLTAFPPTPFGIANGIGMLRKTAEKRGLKTNSDLVGQAEEMTIIAPTYCHISDDCLGGIEQHYNTAFEAVSYERSGSIALTWRRREPKFRYEVLEDEESDASMLFTTDGRLTEKNKFVILEDDRHAFPAGNVVWVTSPEIVDEAGPDYEKAIVDAQKGLTLGVIRELNAKIELEGKSPAKVAAEYLKSIHYTG